MTDPLKTNKYTSDARGERTPAPQMLMPANLNPPLPQARPPISMAPYPPTYSFENPPPRESHRPAPVTAAEPGFYIVPRSVSAGELYRSLFEALPPAAMQKYSALNPDLEGTVKAGSLIVLSDPNNTSCT